MKDFVGFLKFALIVLIILFAIAFVISMVTFLLSPPSQANFNDKVTIDIGDDGYLVANINSSLQYKSEKIPDGEVNKSGNYFKWKDAKNVSYVDLFGKKSYAIVWKTPLKDSGVEVTDKSKAAYNYGEIFDFNGMYGVYYLQYNPQNKMIYGIFLDNGKSDLDDLLFNILKLNKSDINYHNYDYPSYHSSSRYHVDDSPSTIARNDPDWYYDHYEYGDNYYIDDYLESQGYD